MQSVVGRGSRRGLLQPQHGACECSICSREELIKDASRGQVGLGAVSAIGCRPR